MVLPPEPLVPAPDALSGTGLPEPCLPGTTGKLVAEKLQVACQSATGGISAWMRWLVVCGKSRIGRMDGQGTTGVCRQAGRENGMCCRGASRGDKFCHPGATFGQAGLCAGKSLSQSCMGRKAETDSCRYAMRTCGLRQHLAGAAHDFVGAAHGRDAAWQETGRCAYGRHTEGR